MYNLRIGCLFCERRIGCRGVGLPGAPIQGVWLEGSQIGRACRLTIDDLRLLIFEVSFAHLQARSHCRSTAGRAPLINPARVSMKIPGNPEGKGGSLPGDVETPRREPPREGACCARAPREAHFALQKSTIGNHQSIGPGLRDMPCSLVSTPRTQHFRALLSRRYLNPVITGTASLQAKRPGPAP